MPDWSYHNIFKPLLFRLPAAQARDSTLRTVGRLARSSAGQRLIEFMGHMTPPRAASVAVLGWTLPLRVVIGAGADPHALGSVGLARFGAGLLEIGAVTLHGASGADEVRRDPAQRSLEYPHPNASIGLAELESQLVSRAARLPARLGRPGGAIAGRVRPRAARGRLHGHAAAMTVASANHSRFGAITSRRSSARPPGPCWRSSHCRYQTRRCQA